MHPMGPEGPPRLLPASLALNPSVQAGKEMKLQRASWKRPVTSCAALEKLQVSLAPVPICVKGCDWLCHKNPSPYFGKWEHRRYLPENTGDKRQPGCLWGSGAQPLSRRGQGSGLPQSAEGLAPSG